jgi:hypothetical protein
LSKDQLPETFSKLGKNKRLATAEYLPGADPSTSLRSLRMTDFLSNVYIPASLDKLGTTDF